MLQSKAASPIQHSTQSLPQPIKDFVQASVTSFPHNAMQAAEFTSAIKTPRSFNQHLLWLDTVLTYSGSIQFSLKPYEARLISNFIF